jgi:quinol monooxygenase YgiN
MNKQTQFCGQISITGQTGSQGIFDTFEKEEGRQAHLNGPIAAALVAKVPELLSKPPVIEKVELLAVKAK